MSIWSTGTFSQLCPANNCILGMQPNFIEPNRSAHRNINFCFSLYLLISYRYSNVSALRSQKTCYPREKEVQCGNNSNLSLLQVKMIRSYFFWTLSRKRKAHPGGLFQLSHNHGISQVSDLGREGKGGLQKHTLEHVHPLWSQNESEEETTPHFPLSSHQVFSLMLCDQKTVSLVNKEDFKQNLDRTHESDTMES
jgi:hypothetical protein